MLTLLGTAFLPIVGVEFGWVTDPLGHGGGARVAVLLHVVRVLVRGTWGSMWIGRADLADTLDVAGRPASRAADAPARQVLGGAEAHPPRVRRWSC